MKKWVLGVVLTVMASTVLASEDECALFLCLPGGFPSGCSGAYSAMIDRIKDFKPPLPSFSVCPDAPPNSGVTSNSGYAARIGHGERWVKGTRCMRYGGDRVRVDPPGCTATGYFGEVYSDGKRIGDTYYFIP